MAFFARTFTLDGTAQPLLAAGTFPKPVSWLRIESDTGNAAVLVGGSDLSATVYGASITAGPTVALVLGSGDIGKMNENDIFVKGTDGQKLRIVGNTP